MNLFSAMEVPLEGNRLVEASAGTGKTYAITTLFVRAIVERGLAVDEILVVTFTEAATAELRGRIRARLRAALGAFEGRDVDDPALTAMVAASGDRERDRRRLQLALSSVDEAAVSTIHGFCHRVLSESAFESGADFDVELVSDARSLRDEVVRDFFARTLAEGDPREVRALRDHRVQPSTCRRLADAVIRSPDLQLVPEAPPRPALPEDVDLAGVVARLGETWEREVVRQLVDSSVALHRGVYKRPSLNGWLDEIDHFLAAPPRVIPAEAKWMVMLSTAKLEASVKKAYLGQHPRHPFFEACGELHALVQQFEEWSASFALWFRAALAQEVRSTLVAKKRDLGLLTFDDLLLRVDQALGGPGGAALGRMIASRHPVALVDEFQDTDPVQYRIFERIWPEGARYLIGDPKQAIYAFRGADVFAYLRAAEALPETHRYTMATNWRSDPALLRGVAAILRRQPSPFLMEGVGFVDVSARPGASDGFEGADAGVGEAPLSVMFFEREDKAADARLIDEAVAADVARCIGRARIDGRSVTAGDIAVLTRTNREAFGLQRALRRHGVPTVVLGDQSVFEGDHPEARELQLVLAAAAEPTRSSFLRAALTTQLVGLSASDLIRLDEDRMEDGEDGWDAWIARFRRLNLRWTQRGFIQMIQLFFDEVQVEPRLLALEDGERRLTNLRHLVELLHTAASTQHLGPSALLGWLATQREPDHARARPETAQVRLESDEHAVKLTTVHRSKGLEYPIVYAPYLHGGLHQSDLTALEVHEGHDARLHLSAEKGGEAHERARWEELAENARLLYVALTRAKHRCVIAWGGFYGWETSALGYLLHAPPTLGPTPTAAEVKARLKGVDDARMRADLDALVQASEGAIEMRPPPEPDAAARPRREETTIPELKARRIVAPITRWCRTASFSELAARGSSEGRDHDEAAIEPLVVTEAGGRDITLAGFPRGAEAGNFFHALLEEIDFESLDERRPERLAFIEDKLRAHGLEGGESRGLMVMQALDEILAASLEPGSRKRRFILRDVPAASRIAELEFFLPVASASRVVVPKGMQMALLFPQQAAGQAVVELGAVTARRLAAVFADHPGKTLDPGYAERVERLEFVPLGGYLKGYIDLVMQVDGRWYVVDYKSNHLGDRLADYRQGSMMAAMSHGHYYLQSHLYALAVHRLLGRRMRGYRYDQHFGGIFYLFLKGMQPGSRTGVFFHKPPRARLDALGDLLDQPGWER